VSRTITDAQVEEVVVRTLEEVPAGATHWSKRELAREVGICGSFNTGTCGLRAGDCRWSRDHA
jgi:phosphoglucomutase